MRRPRGNYKVRAYVLKDNGERLFWCNITKKRIITTDIGEQMASTSAVIRTPSDIEFEENDLIKVGHMKYTVDAVDEELDPDTNHSRRPRFIQRLDVS